MGSESSCPCTSKGRVLPFSFWFVPKLLESFGYVPWHGQMHLALDVIPIESDANLAFATPVGGDFVVLFKDRLEVLCVFSSAVFDPKIINY